MDNSTIVRMANQIAGFFASYDEKEALQEISDHVNRFWEPRMRGSFFAHIDAGGEGFHPLVIKAAKVIRRPGESPTHVREPKDRKTGLPKEAHEA